MTEVIIRKIDEAEITKALADLGQLDSEVAWRLVAMCCAMAGNSRVAAVCAIWEGIDGLCRMLEQDEEQPEGAHARSDR